MSYHMKTKKNMQIINKSFFHILGCCLLCCENLINNKGTKIGEEAHM